MIHPLLEGEGRGEVKPFQLNLFPKLSGIALILTFSPWEKEQVSSGSGIASTRPANAVAGISSGRRMIHPLLEGEGRGEVKPFQLNLFPKLSGIALILTFSPWEKEQVSRGSGIASTRPANAVEGISSGRRMIHPLLEGEGRGEVKPFQLNLFPKLSGIALILTFSPWEKEQVSRGSGIASTRPANAVEGISSGRRMIHPLLEGEGRGEVKPFQLNLFPKLSGIALILTFSPWEKEQISRGSGIASTRPANAVEGISSGRPMIPANARGLCWRGQAFSVSVYKSPRLARAGGDNAL
jgi:hypothetical protein